MKSVGNILLITGGGSGLGLATAFHALGNKVIVAERRQDVLERVAAAHLGMEWAVVDIQDTDALAESVRASGSSIHSLTS